MIGKLSENTGFTAYLVLLTGTFLFLNIGFEHSARLAGGLGIVWGCFLVMRLFWVSKILSPPARRIHKADKHLPDHILNTREERLNEMRRAQILKIFNKYFFIWLGLCLIVLVCTIASHFRPVNIAEYNEFLSRLNVFFGSGYQLPAIESNRVLGLLPHILPMLLPPLSFWLVQSFVYAQSHFEIVKYLCLSGLFLSLLVQALSVPVVFYGISNFETIPVLGYGPYRTDILVQIHYFQDTPLSSLLYRIHVTGFISNAFIYLLSVLVAYVVLRHVWTGRAPKKYAAYTLVTILTMQIYDLFMAENVRNLPFWLMCWTWLGALWARTSHMVEKKHLLRQL